MPFGAHLRLVVEDPAEMVAVGKDFGLVRQVGAAAVDQIDARQPVLLGDLLRAEVLLDRKRIVSAAFDRRVVAHDHHLPARHPADAGDDARAGHFAVIHVARRELADLEERRAGIEQPLDAVAGEQLAALNVALAVLLGTAYRCFGDVGAQFLGERAVMLGARAELFAVGRDFALDTRCAHTPINSRPMSMRRISLVPAPMSSSLASR